MKLYTGILAMAAIFTNTVIAFDPSVFNISDPKPWGFFVNNTIYQPASNETIAYPRYTELDDGTILTTGSFQGHTPSYLPIFESKDGGATWKHISNVYGINGSSIGVQPALAVLTEAMGDYAAGTVLASSNTLGANFTRISLYASRDTARTWEFVSNIAESQKPGSQRSIFEPYLLQYNGQLVAYYSDERDPEHSQKLSHQVSSDMKTWGPVVDDVAYDQPTYRPGMTVIAYIPPIQKWILVHEQGFGRTTFGVSYPVYYVLADSPLEFGENVGQPLVIDGRAPGSSPYVVWSPIGGPNGTIVVSDASNRQVFTNTQGGAVDKWEKHATPAGSAYARSIQILKDRPEHLVIYGGESWTGMLNGGKRPMVVTVVNLTEVLSAPAS